MNENYTVASVLIDVIIKSRLHAFENDFHIQDDWKKITHVDAAGHGQTRFIRTMAIVCYLQ